MADNSEPTVAAPPPSSGNAFLKRELNGASFLTLEHILHMVLVVVVAGLLAVGLTTGLNLWTGSGAMDLWSLSGLNTSLLGAQSAVGVVAALLLTVPLLVVLDRRTRAEWLKRPGYSGRVAYKVPVYAALGVLFAAKLVAEIAMVSVVLQSLLVMGVPGFDIGNLYLTQFVPGLIGAIVFGAAGWYVFKLAKGRDAGRQFSMGAALVAAVLCIALLATGFNVMRAQPPMPNPDDYMQPFDDSRLEDLFNY